VPGVSVHIASVGSGETALLASEALVAKQHRNKGRDLTSTYGFVEVGPVPSRKPASTYIPRSDRPLHLPRKEIIRPVQRVDPQQLLASEQFPASLRL